jgi:rod shape-determining protein MreD
MNFMGLDFLDPDLLTIIIAYLFLFYGPAATCAFAFGQGLLIDVFSGGLQGLFAFLYLSIFGGIYLGCRFFNLNETKGQALLISLSVVLKRILFIIVLSVFSQGVIVSSSFLWKSAASAIGTGLIAPFIFLLFDSLRSWFLKGASKSSPEQL